MKTYNEFWLWRESTGWVLHVRPLSRAELDAIERGWAHVAAEGGRW